MRSLRPRLLDPGQSSRVPETSKLLDRRRGVAAKVIVGVRVDQHATSSDLVTIIDPALELRGAIDDGLVPGRRLFLDGLPVPEPADVLPIGRDRISRDSEACPA